MYLDTGEGKKVKKQKNVFLTLKTLTIVSLFSQALTLVSLFFSVSQSRSLTLTPLDLVSEALSVSSNVSKLVDLALSLSISLMMMTQVKRMILFCDHLEGLSFPFLFFV